MTAFGGYRCRAQFAWLALAVGLSGCATSLEGHYRRLRPAMARGDWPLARKLMEGKSEKLYGRTNRVLYDLDMATVYQGSEMWDESHRCFEAAKQDARKLYTKSLTTEAWSLATSDVYLPYIGEDYERGLIHVMDAFGYMAEGRIEEARVEARQMTQTLAQAGGAQGDHPSRHADDAFCHYLAGLLWQSEKDELQALSDAWIEVRRAIELYTQTYVRLYGGEPPDGVIALGLELTHRLGKDFEQEHRTLRDAYPKTAFYTAKQTRGRGRVVLVLQTGEAPHKVDAYWTAPAGLDIINVAYPRFVTTPGRVARARMRPVGSQEWAPAELVEDVATIARLNLDDHMGRIRARATARAVTKHLAGTAAEVVGIEKGGGAGALIFVAGTIWNLSNALTAEADKRSWRTLPGAMWLGQMWLTPGARTVEVELLGPAGDLLERRQITLEVRADATHFVPLRSFR